MKIGIDTRCLEWQRGGVARYLANMLQRWPSIARQHRYVLYFQDRVPADSWLDNPAFEHRVVRGPWFLRRHRILTEQLLMPLPIARDKLDLFFATWYTAPLVCPCPKTVVAAWDISYSTHPTHYRMTNRISLGFFSRRACRRAAGVMTCSPFDARQIEKHYGVPGNRICTLELAPEEKFRPPDNGYALDRLRAKYRLPSRYLLSLGVIYNRRNVSTLIDAYTDLTNEYPDVGLVVVGRNETVPRVNLEARMEHLAREGRGIYLPWIPEEEMVHLYGGAWYYICTSTVDGESIMLKEAMRCGTPVITSPLIRDSVAGHALIIEDPTDRAETGRVLQMAIESSAMRNQYATAGLRWVQTLSWDKVAEDSLRFLESR